LKLFFAVIVLFAQIVFSQGKSEITTDEKTGKPMLIGEVTREAFEDTSFMWFDNEYSEYRVDTSAIKGLEEKISKFNFKIILGTWCEDSQMFVPRLIKIFDKLNLPEKNYSLICVNREKKGLTSEVDNFNIQLVPTIIISFQDVEIGRIVESPQENLEKDIVRLIAEQKF
jgi:hypothetical protein